MLFCIITLLAFPVNINLQKILYCIDVSSSKPIEALSFVAIYTLTHLQLLI